MEEKAKNTPKKKPWKPMEMAKVPLDPQQAVLTCCEQPTRGYVWGAMQCDIERPGCEDVNFSAEFVSS